MEWSSKLPTQSIILVSIGGGASGTTGDDIKFVAKELGENAPGKIYYGYGTPVCWPKYAREQQAKRRFKEIKERYDEMVGLGLTPKVILVGKSMGGCILHMTSRSLHYAGINVDIFIGVDMSCTVECHYEKWLDGD